LTKRTFTLLSVAADTPFETVYAASALMSDVLLMMLAMMSRAP